MSPEPTATLYRMVLADHVCPFGVHAKQLLEQHGYEVYDCTLRSRPEVDAFKAQQGVATTPVIFIDRERIDGSEQLEVFLSGR